MTASPYIIAAIYTGAGKLGYSDDAVTWSQTTGFGAVTEFAYFVRCVDAATWLCGGKNSYWKSPDGLAWSAITPGLDANTVPYGGAVRFKGLYCIASAGDGVHVCNPMFRKSSDLTTWASPTTANAGFGTSIGAGIYDMATDGNILVAVGRSIANNYQIAWSNDGDTWTSASMPSDSTGTMGAIAYSPALGKWVAGGTTATNKNFWISSDGKTWVDCAGAQPAGWARTDAVSSMAWSPSLALFVAVGAGGRVATSPDGDTWTARTGAHGADLIRKVAWAPAINLFIATGDNGPKVSTSPNGTAWTLRSPGFTGGVTIGLDIGISQIATPSKFFSLF